VLVAYPGNLSYSGGKDQEDYGLRPALKLENTQHKKGLVEWLKW
jgi:hypothetical protein